MIWLYNIILLIAIVVSSPYWIVNLLFSGTWRTGFRQRLGFNLPLQLKPTIWLHAASVGEVKIAAALVKKIRQRRIPLPVIVSVITPAGFEQAKVQLAGRAEVVFAPLDLSFTVSRFIKKMNPAVLGIIETELWPNLIAVAAQRGVKIILLNGRLSDKSYPVYQKYQFLFRTLLQRLDYACVQTEEDKERFMTLGLREGLITVSSSIKYDFEVELAIPLETIRKEFQLQDSAVVWVAGSTRKGEEAILIEAYQIIKEQVPGLKLVLAPRHIERVREIEKLLTENKVTYFLTSKIKKNSASFECLVIDRRGELLKAYAIAEVVFVGGSLVDFGGQNILEPAALAKAVVFGPYMGNFKESAGDLLKQSAVVQVKNLTELIERVEFLLTHQESARQMGILAQQSLTRKKGAVDKNIEAMERLLAV
ncbi:MAG: 3-deoxy-D-manno-octulosonic acid transferase [Elusimicrobia bacterium]|nr:3-deoxy-D-manno-octulosonic acid transferase [Elusimicrobiota bacterium]